MEMAHISIHMDCPAKIAPSSVKLAQGRVHTSAHPVTQIIIDCSWAKIANVIATTTSNQH